MRSWGVSCLCGFFLILLSNEGLRASSSPQLYIVTGNSGDSTPEELNEAILSVGGVPGSVAVTLKAQYGVYALLRTEEELALAPLGLQSERVGPPAKLTPLNFFVTKEDVKTAFQNLLTLTGQPAIFVGRVSDFNVFMVAGPPHPEAAFHAATLEDLALVQKTLPNLSATFLVTLFNPNYVSSFLSYLTGVVTPPGSPVENVSHVVEVSLTLTKLIQALNYAPVVNAFPVNPDLNGLLSRAAFQNFQNLAFAGLASNYNYQKDVPEVSLAYEGRNQATVEALRGLGVNLGLYDAWIGYQTSSCQQIHNDVAMRGSSNRIQYMSYPWWNGKFCPANPSASACNTACLTSAFRIHGHQVASVMSSSANADTPLRHGQGVQDLANIRFSSSYQPNVSYFGTMLTQAVSSTHQVAVIAKPQGSPAAVHFQGKTGYTPVAAMIDEQLSRVYPGTQNRDVAVFQAIGNNGAGANGAPAPGVSLLDAQAKNVIKVGGVWHQGTLTELDDVFRSIGVCQMGDCPPWFQPTTPSFGTFLDGRVGVDLAGYVSGYRAIPTRTGVYGNFMHTSSATAAVASHAGMIQAAWRNNLFKAYNLSTQEFGPTNNTGSVFSSRLPWAALKALMSSMAAPYAPDRDDRANRAQQGLGYLEAGRFLQNNSLRAQGLVMHQYDLLQTGQQRAVQVSVPPLQSELRVSLAWADAPALIPGGAAYASGPTLRNDFDLLLISPDGQTVYAGNAGLIDSIYSGPMTLDQATAAADRLESLEHIRVRYPEPGVWQVRIIATAIRADIDPSNAAFNSPYGAAIAIVP